MGIKHLSLSNFRSFKNADIDLTNYNVIIGRNGSGKSNIVEALRFLRHIKQIGLEAATTYHGVEAQYGYGRGLLADLEQYSIGVTFDLNKNLPEVYPECVKGSGCYYMPNGKGSELQYVAIPIGFEISEINYSFEGIDIIDEESEKYEDDLEEGEHCWKRGYRETALLKGTFHRPVGIDKIVKDTNKSHFEGEAEYALPPTGWRGLGTIYLQFDGNTFQSSVKISERPDVELMASNVIRRDWISKAENNKESGRSLLRALDYILADETTFPSSIAVFDFDAKSMKKSKKDIFRLLDEDGSNIATAIGAIDRVPGGTELMSDLLNDALEFPLGLCTSRMNDGTSTFKINEWEGKPDNSDFEFYPSQLSDGTLNVIATILALYFHDSKITIIEEPEKNLHPMVIKHLVAMMNDVAGNKQVIITTHNPEFLRWSTLDSVLLVYRDKKEQCSKVKKAEDIEMVREFVENDIGLDSIFVNNAFGV